MNSIQASLPTLHRQIRQPIRSVDRHDLDSLLPLGIADYAFSLEPATPSTASSASDYSPEPTSSILGSLQRVSLGKGKFSEVLLVRKAGTEVRRDTDQISEHHIG